MARIKGALATRKRRKKVLKLAKGYWGAKSKHFKMAKQAVMKSGNYAYIGRKQRKRDFQFCMLQSVCFQQWDIGLVPLPFLLTSLQLHLLFHTDQATSHLNHVQLFRMQSV